jgi:hypothetical protein
MASEPGWARGLLRAVIWAVVAGIAVAVIQTLAGVTKPLHILVPALLTFVVVGILVEVWPFLHLRDRGRRAVAALAAHSPITIQRRQRPIETVIPEGARGLWDFRRDGERAMKQLAAIAQEMARSMTKNTKQLQRHTRRLTRAGRRGVDVEGFYALTEAVARDMNRHATIMDNLEARQRRQSSLLIENYRDFLRAHPPEEFVTQVKTELSTVADSLPSAIEATQGYRTSVQESRQQNINQPTNQATDRLVGIITRILENYATTEQFCRNPQADRASPSPRRSTPRRGGHPRE